MVARMVVSAFPLAAILACAQPAVRDPDRPPDPAARSTDEQATDERATDERGAQTMPSEADSSADEGEPGGPPADMATLLERHNHYRERHCAPPLSWSEELAQIAERWAADLRERGCPLEHSRHAYGENLAAGTPGALDAERVVDLWYEEIDDYDFDNPGFSMETGHFTQLVWISSRELGCARTSCPGMDLWICNYAPTGNVLEVFEDNVLPADSC